MKIRHLIDALPLLAIALVTAASAPKFFPLSTDAVEEKSDHPKVVTVPEKRELPQSEQRQVLKVGDGDTITVSSGWGKEKIRLCGIDAPESSQRLGSESRANLQRLINEAGGQVALTVVDTDRYGRKVAEVFTTPQPGTEKFLNGEQVITGMAWVYRKHLKDCLNESALLTAEEIGKKRGAGVFGDPSSIPPWQYRQTQRQNKGN